jgi:hypothetical protein
LLRLVHSRVSAAWWWTISAKTSNAWATTQPSTERVDAQLHAYASAHRSLSRIDARRPAAHGRRGGRPCHENVRVRVKATLKVFAHAKLNATLGGWAAHGVTDPGDGGEPRQRVRASPSTKATRCVLADDSPGRTLVGAVRGDRVVLCRRQGRPLVALARLCVC